MRVQASMDNVRKFLLTRKLHTRKKTCIFSLAIIVIICLFLWGFAPFLLNPADILSLQKKGKTAKQSYRNKELENVVNLSDNLDNLDQYSVAGRTEMQRHKKKDMKINIFLLVFYEDWPPHMITFFHTARYNNPTVTFTLISNLNFSHPSWATEMFDITPPPNVKLVSSTFESLRKRIEEEDALGLGLKVNISTPYKLCDVLPGCGKLFEEELVGYTHWGYASNDVFLGDLKDIYESEYQDEDILYYDKRLYFNSLTLAKVTEHAMTLYKRADKGALKYTFVDTPDRPVGFDEETITCHLMLDSNVSARLYDADCGEARNFWWYQGKMFNDHNYGKGKKCMVYHFGGRSRAHAKKVKVEVLNEMRPYFEKGYYLNSSIGFGLLGGVSVFFTVNSDDASLTIFDHFTDTGVVTQILAQQETKWNHKFQMAYSHLYPNVSASIRKTKTKFISNKKTQKKSTTSSARIGNAEDLRPLGKKCRRYATEKLAKKRKESL